jgi:hypothetical protein
MCLQRSDIGACIFSWHIAHMSPAASTWAHPQIHEKHMLLRYRPIHTLPPNLKILLMFYHSESYTDNDLLNILRKQDQTRTKTNAQLGNTVNSLLHSRTLKWSMHLLPHWLRKIRTGLPYATMLVVPPKMFAPEPPRSTIPNPSSKYASYNRKDDPSHTCSYEMMQIQL